MTVYNFNKDTIFIVIEELHRAMAKYQRSNLNDSDYEDFQYTLNFILDIYDGLRYKGYNPFEVFKKYINTYGNINVVQYSTDKSLKKSLDNNFLLVLDMPVNTANFIKKYCK